MNNLNNLPQSEIPIPQGAVDLGRLRQAPPQVKQSAIVGVLQQNGLVCPCGAPVESGGVEIAMLAEGTFDTPQGPAKGVGVNRMTFHSQECSTFQQIVARALQDENVLAVSVQPAPERVWLKRPETPS